LAQFFASRLRGMNVLTDRGMQVGKLLDILVDEKSGKIFSIVVKPANKESLSGLPRDDAGNALLPFSSVMAIKDYIVVNERVLMIQQLKQPPAKAPTETPAPPVELPPL
jgi:sporulation protein YlmC with PRC-barrel domain